MSEELNEEMGFKINVNDKTYSVIAYCNEVHCSKFKIETDCEYLFTLCTDEEGNWEIENDVTVLDDNLVEQIGRAIEEHDIR